METKSDLRRALAAANKLNDANRNLIDAQRDAIQKLQLLVMQLRDALDRAGVEHSARKGMETR